MKSKLLFLGICIVFLGCKKNKVVDEPLLENYPQSWIFTYDYSNDEYLYFYTKPNNMYTDRVLKSYSLMSLQEDVDCKFYLNLTRGADGKQYISIQLDNNKERWVYAHESTNRQEKHMGISKRGLSDLDNDEYEYMFIIHKIEHSSGVKTVAIESVAYPGYFISASPPGFNYASNQLTLEKESRGPEYATAWQCR